jgi:hypothetical protein
MKLGAVKTNEFASNADDHGNYRVANNAAMQKILSDSLYQDKPKSVIREISCNGLDAHFEAGISSRPIKVTFPTSLDPTFSVRDFGKGLSLEELKELYTVYGISTKRGSDDAIGGFGIGSKSPFCYTKMWNVISRHNGMKYVVCNSIDSRERFCYDVLHQEECDEPSGIEVRFDVERRDFDTFTNKAKEVFKYFNVQPETNINLNIEVPKYELKTDEYGILSYGNGYNKNQVIVGQVAYPLDSSPFKGNARIILDNCTVHVFCKIKDIQVAPSREAISHEAHNIGHISAILEDAYKKIKEETDKKIKGCKTLWEARLFANKYFGSSSYIGRILGYEMDFKGTKVKQQSYVTPYTLDKDGKKIRIELSEFKATRDHYTKKVESIREQKKHVSIDVDETVRFAIYEKGGFASAKRYMEQNPEITLYVIEDIYKDYVTKELGYPEADLLYTSSFPVAVRQARVKSVKNKIQAYKYRNGSTYSYYNDHARNYWKEAEVDIDVETGYYAPIKAFLIKGQINPDTLKSIPVGVNILGILERREDKVKTHANWKHISEYFKEKLDKLAVSPAVQKYSNVSGYSDNLKRLSGLYSRLKNKTTPFAQMLLQVIDYDKNKGGVEEFNEVKKIYERLSGETYVVKSSPKIDLNFDFLKTYPILKYVNSAYFNSDEVVNYINQVS